jgi:integrase/recombinase XerC
MSVATFTRFLQYEKRFSLHTVRAYSRDLEAFLAYQQHTYQVASMQEINHSMIRSWVVSLMEQQLTPRSVNRKISTLKTYCRFLLRSGELKKNPMLKVLAPKTSKRLPVYVEQQQMQQLFDGVVFEDGFAGLRDRVLLELFYATGMRLSELVSLKEADIDFGSSSVKVLGKRNKERIVPLTPLVLRAIRDYLGEKRKNGWAGEARLFVTDTGKPVYAKLVYRIVKHRLGQVTTLEKKSPHVLRHTFATHMLNNGADINTIKDILGHANLSATQVYTHNSVEKLKSVYKQAHPKA